MNSEKAFLNEPIALVTGAAGFIGRNVCKVLSDMGWYVCGLGHGDWIESEYSKWGVSKWLQGDVSIDNLKELLVNQSPSIVIHCAGSGSVQASYESPGKDFDRTVGSTSIVLEFVRAYCSSETRLVVASSAAVYGNHGDIHLSESSSRNPMSPYGFNKVAAENLCEMYSRFFETKVSIVRLFSVFGDGLQKQLLWDASHKFSEGKTKFFGTGEELRDWIHVSDAAMLLYLAATSVQDKYEIYNGGHFKCTTKSVLNKLATLFGVNTPLQFDNVEHVGNPKQLTANCNKAQLKLNWVPVVDLHDGLKSYVNWYQQRK